MSFLPLRRSLALVALPLLLILVAADAHAAADTRDFTGAQRTYSFVGFNGGGFRSPLIEGFLDSAIWQVLGLSTDNVTFRSNVTTGDAARGISNGNVTVGGIYAFQVASGVRTLGFKQTDTVLNPGQIILQLLNSTTASETIDNLAVSYDLWTRNNGDRSTRIQVQWTLDNTNWHTIDEGTVVSPALSDSPHGWSSRRYELPLRDLNWERDQVLKVRWLIEGVGGTGSYDEFGIGSVEVGVITCGNGVLEPSEDCEPVIGGRDDRSICNMDCTWSRCGDGIANGYAGEECDEPGSAACNDDCTVSVCGDGVVNLNDGEACDAGTAVLTSSFLSSNNSLASADIKTRRRGQGIEIAADSWVSAIELELSPLAPGACDGATIQVFTTLPGTSSPNQSSVWASSSNYSTGPIGGGWMRAFVEIGRQFPAGKYVVSVDPATVPASCIWRGGTNNPYAAGQAFDAAPASPTVLPATGSATNDFHVAVHRRVMSATCNDDCTLAHCGDGIVNAEAGELCDDSGNSLYCNANCSPAVCGDGFHNPVSGEQCDDGGDSATCDYNCSFVRCGDLYINEAAGEECEDGNSEPGDGCDENCRIEVCGNGIVQVGEQCDDGGVDTANCNADCTFARCGDGMVNEAAGEECDEGGVSSATCNANCTLPRCGDGSVNREAGEDCDSGGSPSSTCTSECTTSSCGDGIVNEAAGEQCDDGNTVNGDGCSSQCLSEFCGDGRIQVELGEQCDDGNTVNGDGCDEHCRIEACGNGIVQGSEECDESGETATCNGNCTHARCGDGVLNRTAGEECDDGNNNDGDGCSGTCVREFCGDGIVQPGIGEQCDEGIDNGGPLCDSNCRFPLGTGGNDVGLGSDVGPGGDTGTGSRTDPEDGEGCCAIGGSPTGKGLPIALFALLLLGLRRRQGE